ncbi:MAG: class B sortase [Oscillospiraceae bacterium]|nr:class B sortase [Oscillospiraceae bacterium]
MSKILAVMALFIGLALAGYAGKGLLDTQKMNEQGQKAYSQIRESIKKSSSGDLSGFADSGSSNDTGYLTDASGYDVIAVPELFIDFDMLAQINTDAAAWLYSPGTVIDYPVMRADDYSFYLNHLPDKSVNKNGSLFIDYNNSPDFKDFLTVIYGHHMKSGEMFGSLVKYKEQEYFDDHPFMYLYTNGSNYRIDIAYGFVISARDWSDNGFMYEENLPALLSYAQKNTTFFSEMEGGYTQNERIIALSTCSYEYSDARYVIIGILREA